MSFSLTLFCWQSAASYISIHFQDLSSRHAFVI